MKIYKSTTGILVENNSHFYSLPINDWDRFINDDSLFSTIHQLIKESNRLPSPPTLDTLLTPIGSQELWACGVTYLSSKIGREQESKAAGTSDVYTRVYDAVRPEVFFKANPHRIVGHLQKVHIRKDSNWDVPEPELTLVVTSNAKIVGYTIGNDMSSRSIEGENPLYLPQAKTYDACAAIGPCIYVPEKPISLDTWISLSIIRNQLEVFRGNVQLKQMKRQMDELVSFVYKECSFPVGCYIMTGTAIVPDSDFTLTSGDIIHITIDNIGTLTNTVR
jgi:2-dehydro-3-deoxy-D-arabinonate dehydratase